MLWIGLHLPLLSLESFAATLPAELRRLPLALVETDHAQPRVVHANDSARRLGVRPGLRRATALGLVPQLVVAAADARRDAAALRAVAHACLAFTPSVAAEPPRQVLLEVRASLRCFGGLAALLGRLHAALEPLGHALRCASAPTAHGAALLSRLPRPAGPADADADLHCADLPTLRAALDAAPAWLLAACRAHRDALLGMGLSTIADLRALPRAGLARRFGEALLDELDRACGERPDPRAWVVAPAAFDARLELFARADGVEQVLHGAGWLLARLAAWLAARQAAARGFRLLMRHEARRRRDEDASVPPCTALAVALAAPSRDGAHLLALLRERLARLALAAPAHELRLLADDIVPAPPRDGELFFGAAGDGRDDDDGLLRLVERMQARLGDERVRRPLRLDDHRPERATRLAPHVAGPAAPRRPPPVRGGDGGFAACAGVTRPVWLLDPPRPLPERDQRPLLDGAALRLLAGPERIEAGWWDEALAARDYFIAQAADGSLVWIYRLRVPSLDAGAAGWHLHGRFG